MQGVLLVAHHTVDWLQLVVGGALFWAPGLAWAWAWMPAAPWSQRVPVSIILAFTLTPALSYLLNLGLGVPLRLDTIAFGAAWLTVLGVLAGARRHRDRWDIMARGS